MCIFCTQSACICTICAKAPHFFVRFCCRTPQGVRGLKYLLCLRVNLNRESHPALWKSQEKSNEKSNDKVPDKVQVSMREPVEETRDLIALYAESSQAQHMCLALLENIISVLQSTCKNRA